MLAANADFQIRLHTASTLGAHADELAHAIAIEHLKRIVSARSFVRCSSAESGSNRRGSIQKSFA